jgi:hypothetical protein
MAKPFMRVRLDKPMLPSQNKAAMRLKAAATPKPVAAKAAAAAVDRANRAQAMEAREARAMGVGGKGAGRLKATAAEAAAIDRANRAQAREASFIRTTVRERTTPPKKK